MKKLASLWRRPRLAIEAVLFIGVLLAGFAFRIHSLDAQPFWVDEAESSINALSIIENGYPSDTYLGLPIYENSLVEPWPGNSEYAYRDASYSDNHFAVYHGWLPLYSIAGSFALQGVEPAKADAALSVKYDLSERKRRTRAARLPAALFGILFLALVFIGGTVLYGRDAGWAALVMGAFHPYHLVISRQARYYSAEVALTTACCICIWLLIKQCKWSHVLMAAFSFILLFHTHLLSFATAALVCALTIPFILGRHRRALVKMTAFAGMVAAGTLPWIVATDFVWHQSRIPRAWPNLRIPADLWQYPPFHWTAAVVGILFTILFAGVLLVRRRLPVRVVRPADALRAPLLLLCLWAVCGYALFLLCMPLVSFDSSRLNLSYWGPSLLLAAFLCAALARILAPRYTILGAPLILLLLFFATGHQFTTRHGFSSQDWAANSEVLNYLASLHPDRGTRFYSAPNDHLVLTFYSGLPIQDISPIRRSFLNSYTGEIIYIDPAIAVDTGVLDPQNVALAALRDSYKLTAEGARQWSEKLRTHDYRERISQLADGPLPPFARKLLDEQRRRAADVFSHSSLELMTRGFPIRSWTDWRNVLKYRFVDPQAHSGVYANYAERLCGASVTILPKSETAVYISPAR